MAKEGSTVSGLMDSFATAISISLQHGVPLRVLCEKFAHTRFEPSGWTGNPEIGFAKSIMDYIFRWIQIRFLSGHQLDLFANMGPAAGEAPPPKPSSPTARSTTSPPHPTMPARRPSSSARPGPLAPSPTKTSSTTARAATMKTAPRPATASPPNPPPAANQHPATSNQQPPSRTVASTIPPTP